MIKQLLIEEIRTDGGTQSRCDHDRDLVSEYSRAMYDGAVFPPMLVFFDGTNYWLADGFHRHAAYVDIGQAFVDVQVKEGSLRDAQLYSFSANANHGKRRTNADKRKAVLAMLADAEWCQWSDREIAKACSVHNSMVSRVRSEAHLSQSDRYEEPTVRKVTRNGTTYEQDTTKIGRRGEQEPEYEILDAEPKQSKASQENDEDTPPPEVIEYTAEQAQADVQEKFAQEHELRMAELAHLMGEEDQLANALKEVERLSLEIAQRDEMISMYKLRLNGMTSEMNVLKTELAKYKKAFAAKDKAAK